MRLEQKVEEMRIEMQKAQKAEQRLRIDRDAWRLMAENLQEGEEDANHDEDIFHDVHDGVGRQFWRGWLPHVPHPALLALLLACLLRAKVQRAGPTPRRPPPSLGSESRGFVVPRIGLQSRGLYVRR